MSSKDYNYTKNFANLNKKSVDIAGGKGASLGEMTNAKIPVPPGFVVLAPVFDRFLKETDLMQDVEAQIAKVNYDDVASVERCSVTVRDLINDAAMPTDITEAIIKEFKKLDSQYVAVRSSATAEDSSVASWAGELDSFLNTNEKTLLDNVKNCWSSLFTPRAIFYRKEKKLHDSHVSVAVVVQAMIQSEVAGITFTVHPVTEDKNQMIIEAGWGLGDAIVSGQITPDSYVINKTDWSIIDININAQKKYLVRDGKELANKWEEVPESKQEKQILSDEKIVELAKICLGIEEHYKFPQDIEWALYQDKLYITQSRPITTL